MFRSPRRSATRPIRSRSSAGAGRAERIMRRKRAELSPTTDHHATAPTSQRRATPGTAFLLVISHGREPRATGGRDGSERSRDRSLMRNLGRMPVTWRRRVRRPLGRGRQMAVPQGPDRLTRVARPAPGTSRVRTSAWGSANCTTEGVTSLRRTISQRAWPTAGWLRHNRAPTAAARARTAVQAALFRPA